MRPTDPRELLHPVLEPETYRRLGIAPPRPPQQYGTGGPVSSAGTPYLTGRAVTGAPAPSGPGTVGQGAVGRDAHAGTAIPAADGPGSPPYVPAPPTGPAPAKDRSVAIVVGATAIIIVIIMATTWYILDHRGGDDEGQIREAIAAETTTLNNRDLSALLGVRCAADVQMLQSQFTSQTFAAEIDSMLGPDGRWDVVVHSVAVDGAAATAEITSTPVGSSSVVSRSVTNTTTLRKESGGWKVCVSDSRGR